MTPDQLKPFKPEHLTLAHTHLESFTHLFPARPCPLIAEFTVKVPDEDAYCGNFKREVPIQQPALRVGLPLEAMSRWRALQYCTLLHLQRGGR